MWDIRGFGGIESRFAAECGDCKSRRINLGRGQPYWNLMSGLPVRDNHNGTLGPDWPCCSKSS